MDFIVGRKYTRATDERIVEVLHVTDKSVLVKLHFPSVTDHFHGKEALWKRDEMVTAGYVEYIPPVTHIVHLKMNTEDGRVFSTGHKNCMLKHTIYLGALEIEMRGTAITKVKQVHSGA